MKRRDMKEMKFVVAVAVSVVMYACIALLIRGFV